MNTEIALKSLSSVWVCSTFFNDRPYSISKYFGDRQMHKLKNYYNFFFKKSVIPFSSILVIDKCINRKIIIN